MRRILLLALLLAGLSQAGCVERLLAIHSDPPGAAVYLDGEKVGTTPCEVTYTWYGTRILILELRGYTLIRQEVPLNPPWWQIIPVDFITDVVIPFTIRDRMAVSYTMEPAPVSLKEVDAVLQRADELRKKSLEQDPAPKQ
ncbi:MAG TPA: PEGA domain-containing protein [Planctomycetota bacterium]|nr:PEGA domain-containing protein [Planctomycetota bacterium]